MSAYASTVVRFAHEKKSIFAWLLPWTWLQLAGTIFYVAMQHIIIALYKPVRCSPQFRSSQAAKRRVDLAVFHRIPHQTLWKDRRHRYRHDRNIQRSVRVL